MNFLKEYADETGIPFSQVFAWFVCQRLFTALALSDFSNNIELLSPASFDPAGSIHRLDDGLLMYYREDAHIRPEDGTVPGQRFSREIWEELLGLLKWSLENEKPKLDAKIEIQRAGSIRLSVNYERMYIPFTVKIAPIKGTEFFPQEEYFSPIWRPDKSISYLRYPIAENAADFFMELITKLELLSEFDLYLYTYELLCQFPISGRDFQEAMLERLNERNITPDQKRMDTFASYRDYSYMKKKWKRLLRRQKLKEPEWEDMFDVLLRFLAPVWEAILIDMIYLGDWMPQLKRFLD